MTRRLHYLKTTRKDRELSVISSKGQGRTSPTESRTIVQNEGKEGMEQKEYLKR